MRKIKFRGISLKTGEFVYGGGVDTQRDTPIIINHGERHFVTAESVAQYIGFKDINGVEIYERDIVKWGHVKGYIENTPREATVSLEPALCFKTFNLGENNHVFNYGRFMYAKVLDKAMEVIGNLDQNKEYVN